MIGCLTLQWGPRRGWGTGNGVYFSRSFFSDSGFGGLINWEGGYLRTRK